MRAGRLRHLVEIQNSTSTPDDQGGQLKTWSTVEKVWAFVEPMSSREKYFVSQLEVWATHTVTMRYTANVTSHSRIILGSRILSVISIANIQERNREIQLICVEEM